MTGVKNPFRIGTFKIHITNLNKDVTEEELKLMFQPFGRIVETQVFKKKNYAFVHMEEEEGGRVAIKELHNKSIEGMVLNVKVAANTEPPHLPVMKLQVKNVHCTVTAQLLRTYFQRFGLVLAVDIKFGVGIVSLEATGDIRSAISEMNGFNLEGKALEVTPMLASAKPPEPTFKPKPRPRPVFRPPTSSFESERVSRNFAFQPQEEQVGYGYSSQGYYEGNTYVPGNRNQFQDRGRVGNTGMRAPPLLPNPGSGYNIPPNFGGGYSMNDCYSNAGNGGQENYDDCFTVPIPPREDSRVFEYNHRPGPGEAFPPPTRPGKPKMERKRGERGGRNRWTVGKLAAAKAMAATGLKIPKGYIPTLSAQSGPDRRFVNGRQPDMDSPNYAPVAEFRGYQVPTPRFRPPPPVFQGPHSAPRGIGPPRPRLPLLRTPTPIWENQPGPSQQRGPRPFMPVRNAYVDEAPAQVPRNIPNYIDFTADIDLC